MFIARSILYRLYNVDHIKKHNYMPSYATLNSYKGKHASYEIMFIFPMSTYISPAIFEG